MISPVPVEHQRCPREDSQANAKLLPALMQSPLEGRGEAMIWEIQATKPCHEITEWGGVLNYISSELACDLTPRAVIDLQLALNRC